MAEANVRSRSSALCGVCLIQVSLSCMHTVNPALINSWAMFAARGRATFVCLFIFPFGLQESNFSEFMGTAF